LHVDYPISNIQNPKPEKIIVGEIIKLRVLFIGGTGVISSACTELCLEKGMDIHLLNRGNAERTISNNVHQITADIRNTDQIKSLLANETYDVIVDWIAYTPENVISDYELFKDKTSQFIFISSASAYQKPPSSLPIKETEPLVNPYWEYSRNKIDCETYLLKAYHEFGFPVTIVRPSHTYDCTKIALSGGYTTLNRIREGKKVIIHGDGTSLWTLTHHRDFACGFIGLLGNQKTIGEAYHITSDEVLTWNQICTTFGETLGVEPNIIHIPSDIIYQYDKEWGDGLLGDKAHCMMFDNSKIREINPDFEIRISFQEGSKEIVAWYDEDPSRKVIDHSLDSKIEEIITRYESFSG
jgi:nucleoside-diphosphate-sugar epimerase